MSGSKKINYSGVVIKSGKRFVTIQITSEPACAVCNSKVACCMFEKKDKIIDVAGNYNLKEGDCVTVQMEESLGYSALILGYLVPLIIVIATLIIFHAFKFRESHAGIIALLSVFPYYFFLSRYKKKMNKKFMFSIKT
jgi:sigma-E factor negative regulatory protein RseC